MSLNHLPNRLSRYSDIAFFCSSILANNETSQEAKTLQSQAPYIENVIKTKFENKSSSSTAVLHNSLLLTHLANLL